MIGLLRWTGERAVQAAQQTLVYEAQMVKWVHSPTIHPSIACSIFVSGMFQKPCALASLGVLVSGM
jgi:hypothetical protein